MIDTKDTLLYKGVYDHFAKAMEVRKNKRKTKAIKDPTYTVWLNRMYKRYFGNKTLAQMQAIANRDYMQDDSAVELVLSRYTDQAVSLLSCDVITYNTNEHAVAEPKSDQDFVTVVGKYLHDELSMFCVMVILDLYKDLKHFYI